MLSTGNTIHARLLVSPFVPHAQIFLLGVFSRLAPATVCVWASHGVFHWPDNERDLFDDALRLLC